MWKCKDKWYNDKQNVTHLAVSYKMYEMKSLFHRFHMKKLVLWDPLCTCSHLIKPCEMHYPVRCCNVGCYEVLRQKFGSVNSIFSEMCCVKNMLIFSVNIAWNLHRLLLSVIISFYAHSNSCHLSRKKLKG